nr:DNA mismatch repair protein MSH2 [Paratrimastix eleionoma]
MMKMENENAKKPPSDILMKTFGEPLAKLVDEFKNLVSMVEATIDLARVDEHQYLINSSFDPDLQEIATSRDSILENIQKIRDEVAEELGLDGARLKLDNNNVLGYYLRISRKDEKMIRKNPNYIALETRKDGVRFTNTKLRNASSRYMELCRNYDAKQKDLENRALDIVGSYIPVMEDTAVLLAQLDVYLGLAQVASFAPIPYIRPIIEPAENGEISLVGMRHPCLEAQDGSNIIPNDCILLPTELSETNGKPLPDRHNFVIVTGPNMGGKSTFIRTVGIIVLMAQIGSFVPCTSAKISVRDRILARVGAGDSLIRGVSTFMAEMLETATILKSATSKSLVIIDELGRGTSTYDGFGLAWAIAEELSLRIKAPTLFATHFHELTALAKEIPSVTNAHVSALTGEDTLTFLYKVESGACERSFGIHVAEMASFPDEVLQIAKKKLEELESTSRDQPKAIFSVSPSSSSEKESDLQNSDSSLPLSSPSPVFGSSTPSLVPFPSSSSSGAVSSSPSSSSSLPSISS